MYQGVGRFLEGEMRRAIKGHLAAAPDHSPMELVPPAGNAYVWNTPLPVTLHGSVTPGGQPNSEASARLPRSR